eukprot:CAMPEP_0194680242 /NCGR_PEP_ID=MMETSP0295-20121207/11313_1 /TAXON_ID=39354 /ORGANISM="Heterosigma akashiwo, Strain CCMP2393" /LENGTH=205 /DNA_ID=CAMNT_0039565883 /DNA_START=156 /DNA_END=771 /DNA_ORIENTATION=+
MSLGKDCKARGWTVFSSAAAGGSPAGRRLVILSGLDPVQGGGSAAEKDVKLQHLGREFRRKLIEVATAQGTHLPVVEAMESFSIGDINGTTGRFTLTSQLNHRLLLDVEHYITHDVREHLDVEHYITHDVREHLGAVFEWESEDGQKKKSFFRRNKSFLQRKTDQLLYQVYKAVEERNGRGTQREKWVKGRLFVNDEVVRLDRGE